MAIPDYQSLLLPVLQVAGDGHDGRLQEAGQPCGEIDNKVKAFLARLIEGGKKNCAARDQHCQCRDGIYPVSCIVLVSQSNALKTLHRLSFCYGVAVGVKMGGDVGVAAMGGAWMLTCSPKFDSLKVRTVLSVSPCAESCGR